MKCFENTIVFGLIGALFLCGCGGGGGDDSGESVVEETMMPTGSSADESSTDIPSVRGEWFGQAFVSRVDCGDDEFEDFNFSFGVNQSGDQVLVSYENFCDAEQDELGSTTAAGFKSSIEKLEGCGGGIEAVRVDMTEVTNLSGDTAEVTITIESTCPEAPCFREFVGSISRASSEQFNCTM